MMKPITFMIEGQCYSLKNSRQLITLKSPHAAAIGITCEHCGRQNHVIHVPNSEAKKFERAFEKQVPSEARQMILTPVRVDIEIFYPSNRSDLDEAIVLDCMQRSGIIRNDRQIVAKWIRKRIDPVNPRVVVHAVEPVAWEKSGRQQRLLNDEAQPPLIEAAI
jgi:Holliday junction resolvase RusA-like endonuclease